MKQVSSAKKIQQLFEEDQQDRRSKKFGRLSHKKRLQAIRTRDRKRITALQQLLKNHPKLRGIDYFRAGIIFQHGGIPNKIKRAQSLALRGMRLGHKKSRWLFAAATDRLLVMKGKLQRFGTQFRKAENGIWELLPIKTATTDAERRKYGVRTLQGLKRMVLYLNRREISARKRISISNR